MTDLDVFIDSIDTAGSSRRVGTAHITRSRGRVSTTFLSDSSYLTEGGAGIDPSLSLTSGAQYCTGLLRAFADSAPDRWGRNLIAKAERARARKENRTPHRLDDLDYLLGVSDNTRQGALRFRLSGSGDFLDKPSTVPKLISLPELLRASDEVTADGDPAHAVKQLLDTGTTGLGGARPKASVRLDDRRLAIAKFPHASDQWNVMAWEATALELMKTAGIHCPQSRLIDVGERSVLVLRRFDRTDSGERIGYISAMTAVEGVDGEQRDYVDLAEAVRDLSLSPRRDLHELFRRVVASVALGNTDDHLRNHGFLASRGSWTLSPAFDVNPNPDPMARRSTSIAGADTFPEEIEGLLALAEDCSITRESARERIGAVVDHLAPWRECARSNRLSEHDITMMAEAIAPRLEALQKAARAR